MLLQDDFRQEIDHRSWSTGEMSLEIADYISVVLMDMRALVLREPMDRDQTEEQGCHRLGQHGGWPLGFHGEHKLLQWAGLPEEHFCEQ